MQIGLLAAVIFGPFCLAKLASQWQLPSGGVILCNSGSNLSYGAGIYGLQVLHPVLDCGNVSILPFMANVLTNMPHSAATVL